MDRKYYKDALDVQDACNGMGVIRSLKEVVAQVEADEDPTSHAALVLYADKLADLCDAREHGRLDRGISIAKVLGIVRDHLIQENACEGTESFNKHPLIRHLTHLLYEETRACDFQTLNKAYDDCNKLSKET